MRDPFGDVGDLLCSNAEAELMSQLADPLEHLLRKYGPEMRREEAVADHTWPEIVALAKQLKELFDKEGFVPPPLEKS